jgi:hypothetical protein
MNITRRRLLLVLGLLAAADYGRSLLVMRAGEPPGWKTERWQAGFGSWASGGYGVAYDISMPKDYDFQQKCGIAWITDDVDGPDFDARLSFLPDPKDRKRDFEAYLKEDAGRYYEADGSAVKISAKPNFSAGGLQLSRLDFTLDNAKAPDAGSGRATGLWLEGEKLSIIADLRDRERSEINERIVGSIRKASGYGFTELLARTIPGLMGC